MAEGHIQIKVEGSAIPHENTPLLKIPDQPQEPDLPDDQETDEETLLDKTLQSLDCFLYFLGFNQSTVWSFLLSWGVFLVIGVLLPVVMLELSNCPGCEKGQIKSFEIGIVVSQACLAAASLICLSHNLRKYGVRKFLFVDRYSGHVERFSDQYVQKISFDWRVVRPLSSVFLAYEVLVLFLSSERQTKAHRICDSHYKPVYDSVPDHRIQGNHYLCKWWDFAVSSVVQVVGIILCLNAAAKISHRAQGIGALASRWHALMACSAADACPLRTSNSIGNLQAANKLGSFHINSSESDLESLDFITAPTNTQLASYMSSYHKRLALVMYLQSNPGGITIFGWTVDRGLINTIFFIELSLVTFVLGKTIVVTPE
ncbi:UNVERIFIED_CONTAM: hypothetical protein Sangu_1813500 [Sesamum angustifolium]|uniref:Uncharacterized protein n=1 Tax=Sesamum angustifolium TaxID=2727405 RepID=A0AAW2M9Y8_9LAMI